mmetsp:Transcript_9678/g.31120  ORF Transcript_9678/g.31120 Transcript_9678/m.31120 type:complete len:211 (+) Transcript_9678:976-1608(+)
MAGVWVSGMAVRVAAVCHAWLCRGTLTAGGHRTSPRGSPGCVSPTIATCSPSRPTPPAFSAAALSCPSLVRLAPPPSRSPKSPAWPLWLTSFWFRGSIGSTRITTTSHPPAVTDRSAYTPAPVLWPRRSCAPSPPHTPRPWPASQPSCDGTPGGAPLSSSTPPPLPPVSRPGMPRGGAAACRTWRGRRSCMWRRNYTIQASTPCRPVRSP